MNGVEVILFLLLLICCGVNGYIINSCNSTISIHCPSSPMCITSVNVTSSITKNIIEECNAQHYCQLQNRDKQCMNITYWCGLHKKIEEFDKFFQPEKVNVSLLGLVTRGYKSKKSQKAENVKCILTLQEHGNADMTNVLFSVTEFAPFSNSTDYCLYVKDSEDPLICSGSGKFHQSYGAYKIENNLHFSLRLSEKATTAPEIRVWIDIAVSPLGEYRIHCYAQSELTSTKNNTITPTHHTKVTSEMTTEKPTSTTSPGPPLTAETITEKLASVPVAVSVLVFIVSCALAGYLIHDRILNVASPRRHVPQPNYRVRNLLPDLSLQRETVNNVRHGSFNTI